jgi:hypothetical protein
MGEEKAVSVTIHFKDGSVQNGLLHSDFLTGRTVRFEPLSSSRDRRGENRLFIIKDVKVDDGKIQRSSDLSSRGLFVETLAVYAVGTILPVELGFEDETIRVKARVAFNDPGIGMGLEFHRPSTGVRLKLEGILEKEKQAATRYGVKDRRTGKERRSDWAASLRTYSKVRKQERRNKSESSGKTVEIKLSDIKAVFFRKSFEIPGGAGEEGVIEFRDGEHLRGRFYDPSPESGGLFVEIRVTPDIHYKLYVTKSAIKSLEYL